jgi:hypothetical protein
LKEKPLLAYYEEVLVEALKLAQTDADRGFLDRMLRIRDAVAEIVDDLSVYKVKADEGAAVEADAKTDAPLAQIDSAEESLGRTEVAAAALEVVASARTALEKSRKLRGKDPFDLNLVGSCTGRSPGLAPLRMRST